MRDGPRQAGDRQRAEFLVDWLVDRLAAEDGATEGRSRRRRRAPQDAEPNVSERITLIEFLWEETTGAQQVILISREWLQ